MADDTPIEKTPEERRSERESADLAILSARPEWKTARRILSEKMLSLTSILDMDEKALNDSTELRARKHACNLVGEWIAQIEQAVLTHDRLAEDDPDADRGLRISQP